MSAQPVNKHVATAPQSFPLCNLCINLGIALKRRKQRPEVIVCKTKAAGRRTQAALPRKPPPSDQEVESAVGLGRRSRARDRFQHDDAVGSELNCGEARAAAAFQQPSDDISTSGCIAIAQERIALRISCCCSKRIRGSGCDRKWATEPAAALAADHQGAAI